jgi:hypothetical protein
LQFRFHSAGRDGSKQQEQGFSLIKRDIEFCFTEEPAQTWGLRGFELPGRIDSCRAGEAIY